MENIVLYKVLFSFENGNFAEKALFAKNKQSAVKEASKVFPEKEFSTIISIEVEELKTFALD